MFAFQENLCQAKVKKQQMTKNATNNALTNRYEIMQQNGKSRGYNHITTTYNNEANVELVDNNVADRDNSCPNHAGRHKWRQCFDNPEESSYRPNRSTLATAHSNGAFRALPPRGRGGGGRLSNYTARNYNDQQNHWNNQDFSHMMSAVSSAPPSTYPSPPPAAPPQYSYYHHCPQQNGYGGPGYESGGRPWAYGSLWP